MEKKKVTPRAVNSMFFSAVICSAMLIIITIVLGWDTWTVPLLLLSSAVAVTTHTMRRPSDNVRMYMYASLFIMQLYYYCTNVKSIYDCTPVVVMAIAIMTLSDNRILLHITMGVGIYGMAYNLLDANIFTRHITFVYSFYTLLHFGAVITVTIASNALIISRRRQEAEYEDRLRVLEKENKSATDFLANVSHEIRTPINVVIGMTNVMLDSESDPAKRENLISVNEAGNRIAWQISDILDYSDIDMARLSKAEDRFNITSLVNDIVTGLRPSFKEGVELILDIDPHIPSVLVTDTRKLSKILRHIIINGIKYTKTGGVYVRICCKKRDYGANLCIDVKDTGIGMTAEELTKVYDRFYQANSGRTRSSSGLGLGLAIVYGFVANLGGFVTMESTPGKGTYVHISIPVRVESFIDCMSLERQKGMAVGIFTDMGRFPPAVREFYVAALRNFSQGLRLPVERADNVDSLKKIMSVTKLSHLFVSRPSYEQNKAFVDSLADSMTVAVIADEGYVLPDRLIFMQKPFYIYPAMNIINNRMINENGGRLMCRGVRALVVDDEPMNLTVAIGIMGRYGIEVTPAASGAESIELVKAQKFDIIFMDHMMPEMDGVTAMKRIRSVFPDPSFAPPVVALTANAVSSAREMFLSEGFDGFVSKPIDLKALEHVLRYLLPAGKVDIQSSSAEPSAVQEEDEEKTAGKILHSHGIDINEGLRYAADDMDFYRKLLKEFADEYPKKTAKLNDFMSADNMPDYAIVVHALKSTAKMIGAGELSEMAKASELAAKADNKAFVKEHHPALADKYGDVINGIREAFGEHSTEDTETAPDDAPMEFMPDDAPMEFMPEEDV